MLGSGNDGSVQDGAHVRPLAKLSLSGSGSSDNPDSDSVKVVASTLRLISVLGIQVVVVSVGSSGVIGVDIVQSIVDIGINIVGIVAIRVNVSSVITVRINVVRISRLGIGESIVDIGIDIAIVSGLQGNVGIGIDIAVVIVVDIRVGINVSTVIVFVDIRIGIDVVRVARLRIGQSIVDIGIHIAVVSRLQSTIIWINDNVLEGIDDGGILVVRMPAAHLQITGTLADVGIELNIVETTKSWIEQALAINDDMSGSALKVGNARVSGLPIVVASGVISVDFDRVGDADVLVAASVVVVYNRSGRSLVLRDVVIGVNVVVITQVAKDLLEGGLVQVARIRSVSLSVRGFGVDALQIDFVTLVIILGLWQC